MNTIFYSCILMFLHFSFLSKEMKSKLKFSKNKLSLKDDKNEDDKFKDLSAFGKMKEDLLCPGLIFKAQ